MASRWFLRNVSHRFTESGSLGARRIHRETLLSETSDFNSHDVSKVPQEISLCLLRVLQEAVHNAAKHSGVKRIEVQLAKDSDGIHLIVSDSGRGFDVEAARQSGGLGITSMQERVRLVGGTIVIDAKPLAGTTIHVCVTFKPEQDGQRQVAPD